MIIVAGIARSGLTVTMQMLNAGGYKCAGEYPAFEPYQIGEIPWNKLNNKAVKLIEPQLQFPPNGEYKIIYLHRNLKEQAKSHNKFNKFLIGLHPLPINALVYTFKKSYKQIDGWACKHDVLHLHFEHILKYPTDAAVKITDFIGYPLDVNKMSAVVINRSPKCHPKLLELDMIKMTKQQFNPEKYAQYLKEKIEFLERQVERLMSRYDRGGTLALFPTYDEWMENGNPFKKG